MKVRFKEDRRKTYSIQWSELLHLDETPLESFDEAIPGIELLAPYHYDSGKIEYRIAGKFGGSYIWRIRYFCCLAEFNLAVAHHMSGDE